MDQSNATNVITYTTTADDAGERLDKLVARVAGCSRQRAMTLLEEGRVRLDRRRPRKGDRPEPGQLLQVEPPPSEAPVAQPELPLHVVHEDAALLALDKPAGMSMHPLVAGETGTLANAVMARFADVLGASTEVRCPGLVHRLDRETSGIVLWARTPEAFEALRRQFSDRTVLKRYHALVEGRVEGEGTIELPLAHDPRNAARMLATPYPADAIELKARPAYTRYRALSATDDATLVEVEIPTGVMHQIRAHFGFAGHPVVGDTLYGGQPVEGLERHLLHASLIGATHPDGQPFEYASPLPESFLAQLERLGLQRP